MGEEILEFLLVLVTSVFLCEAIPDLTTSGNVDFYREGQNITAKWKPLDKVYRGIKVKYCATTDSPCLMHDVRDVKATEVTFSVLQYSKYECALLVLDAGSLTYTSPRMPASFRPDFSDITFVQKDEFITGTWQPFGSSSYTTLKVRWCVANDAQDLSCDLYAVGNVSASTATVKVSKDKRYMCSVLVIDISGESHSSTPILAEVRNTSANIIIIIVVVVVVVALIVVAVVLYLVLKNYCLVRDAYVVMPDTEKEAKKSMKRIRKQSIDYVISEDEAKASRYRAKDGHGQDNHAFIKNEKDKKNGDAKGPKVKKDKTNYTEATIEYSSNEASVEIALKQSDTISLSSKSSQGDWPDYSGGRLEMEVEDSMPDVVTLPELKRKISTDLDAESDVIDNADVVLEVRVEAPVDIIPLEAEDRPYVKMDHGTSWSGDGIMNNVDIEISPPAEDSGSSLSSTRHSDADVEFDGELASRGSIDMADTRFNDARYDGSFDLRFAGVSKRESADSNDADPDFDTKPDYELLESDDDSNVMEAGWPRGFKTQNSLESVEELNLDLAYGANVHEPAVDIALPPIGEEGTLDINRPREKLEATDAVDVGPFDLAAESDDISDVIPDHAGAVIDADRDGGLIHVQEGNFSADVDTPGGDVSFGITEENIGRESKQNSSSEKGDSRRNEPLKRISRKCSKLENVDHVCSHMPKERTHSRSESTSSLCSTCTRSIESSSPTFSRSYSSSGSDTEKDVKDIEDEDDDVLGIGGSQVRDLVVCCGDVDVGLGLDGDASDNFKMGIGADFDVDTVLGENADIKGDAEQGIGGDAQLGVNTEGDAVLSAPAGFADEINIGADDPDEEIDLDSGRLKSTGLNLSVDLGLGGSLI
ncbi:uncharacterized protein LOC135502058 [Lineus longissimus]|uniref:uncharacterized protein LOC135502058 n=1 Tax=Lineus longissimus TaxID=88925 RepID=UPI002B4F3909